MLDNIRKHTSGVSMKNDVPKAVENLLMAQIDPKNLSGVFAELMARRREDLLDYLSNLEVAKIKQTETPPTLSQEDRDYLSSVCLTVAFRSGDKAAHKLMEYRKAASPSIKL